MDDQSSTSCFKLGNFELGTGVQWTTLVPCELGNFELWIDVPTTGSLVLSITMDYLSSPIN